MTPEAKVKVKVAKILREFGAYYVMPVTGGYGNSGAPDFLVCYQGKFIGIECKAGKGRLTALQEHNLINIRKSGGHAIMVNEENINDVKNILERP